MIDNLSVILPYRYKDARRQTIFNWILKRYEILFPEAQLIICDSDEDKKFSRSQSRNYGVDSVDTDYILIADADTMPFRPFVEQGLLMLKEGAPWVLPYGQRGYYNLRKPYSDYVLSQDPAIFITPEKFEWVHQLESWAGQILMHKESFYSVNGYDERFQGWGYEDNAFQRALDTLVGPLERVEAGWTAHIWHEEPRSERWEHPDFKLNEKRMHHYVEATGNYDKMIEVVEGNRE